jgi:hypothetical protein
MNLKFKILIILFFIAAAGVLYLVYASEKVVYTDIAIPESQGDNKIAGNNNITGQELKDEDEKAVEEAIKPDEEQKEQTEDIVKAEEKPDEEQIADNAPEVLKILLDVPFTPQAPFAEWSDPVHQDGCEEAASLMAVSWAKGQSLSRETAKEKIIAASDYQSGKYGEYRDTSATDTAERIIKGYFGHKNVEVKTGITVKDIVLELINGNIIILPMNGQVLGNPYYTPPGPERHMVVVIGYNEEKKEFITNDPGTRRGESYYYPEDVLYSAIRDYPSGYHAPIEKIEKTMIVVKPE